MRKMPCSSHKHLCYNCGYNFLISSSVRPVISLISRISSFLASIFRAMSRSVSIRPVFSPSILLRFPFRPAFGGVVRILFTDIVCSLSSRQMKKIESVLRSIPASRSSIFPHLRIHFNQGNITYIKEARLWKITQSR